MWPFNRKAARARDEPSVLGISVARRTRGDQDMTGSEAIYAAVSRISNTVSCIPVHLYREYELQRDHPLERLVSFAPNERMTGYSFRNVMEACRNTSGNAYAIIVPSDGPAPASLDVLDPERVTPYRERDTGDLWYQVMPDVGAGFWVHHSGMIVLRHTCTNGERGIRPLDV
ncbi:MAG: phage portal protein, partial [Clostridia bacterium]